MPNGTISWVETASKVVTQVGFPVVVAGLLLWWVLFRFETSINNIADRLSQNAASVAVFTEVNKEQTRLMAAELDELRKQTVALQYLADRIRDRDGK